MTTTTYEPCYTFEERSVIIHALNDIASYVKKMGQKIRSGESVSVSIDGIQSGSGSTEAIQATATSKGQLLVSYGPNYRTSYILNGEANETLNIERLLDSPELGVDLILMWDEVIEALEKAIATRAAQMERLMNFKVRNHDSALTANCII